MLTENETRSKLYLLFSQKLSHILYKVNSWKPLGKVWKEYLEWKNVSRRPASESWYYIVLNIGYNDITRTLLNNRLHDPGIELLRESFFRLPSRICRILSFVRLKRKFLIFFLTITEHTFSYFKRAFMNFIWSAPLHQTCYLLVRSFYLVIMSNTGNIVELFLNLNR